MQQVLEKPYVSIYYDPTKYCLHQVWKGSLSVADFKEAIDISVSFTERHRVTSILSDTSNQGVLAKEGTDYASSVMPALIQNGLEKVAFVLPKSAFTLVSVQNFSKQTTEKPIRQFASRQEAEEWLES